MDIQGGGGGVRYHDACDVLNSLPPVNRQTPVKTLLSIKMQKKNSYPRLARAVARGRIRTYFCMLSMLSPAAQNILERVAFFIDLS